jgi:hypothetical protein
VRLAPPPDLLVRAGDDVRLIMVRREAPSIPCTFLATVASTAKPGADLTVALSFWVAGSFAGAAQASFRVVDRPSPAQDRDRKDAPPPETAPTEQKGVAQASATGREPPMLTVLILRQDRQQPDDLTWVISTAKPVAGLPARLNGTCRIREAAEYARSLAKGAAPQRAGHLAFFRGVGSVLWNAAPACFRETYAALRAELGDGFDIQFVSDDPYVPWELIWPEGIPDAGPLAVDHPVARWLLDYETLMDARLPLGRVLSIAPDYGRSTTNTVPLLPSAQLEAHLLRTQHGASAVTPTRTDVLALFGQPPASPVSFLHFAGHGSFLGGALGAQIYLEDDPLGSVEVRADNNVLAEGGRTLVFLNACETGAAGDSLASAGGWAEAFVRRKYGGMIAPLWPVYDDHALRVLDEVASSVLDERRPVAHVLRDIRRRHYGESPTYLAYIFVGDVRARIA